MIPKYRAWNSETKEIEVFKTYEEISELFLALSADDGFYSIMQSTGLKDKNGNEIFEGDVLEIQGIKMIVKFGSYKYLETSKNNGHLLGILHDGLGFYVECINAADPDRISPFEPETLKESAVIGNIYENKDILEVIDEKRK